MTATSRSTGDLAYLSRQDVASVLPAIVEQIDLAQETYVAMANKRVEMPPKPGIHPRHDAFIHAMPVYLTDKDVAAIKWVSGYPDNPALGLPYISGLLVVNDPATGVPLAVMDAVEITAARTAAATGVCIRRWAPEGWGRTAILGCGEQARYHAEMVRALNPRATIAAWDPDASRVAAMPGSVEACSDALSAVRDADVVITAAPIVEDPSPTLDAGATREGALLLPIDFDASMTTALVRAADLFVVDDVAQFEYYRDHGHFRGWPQAACSTGEAIRDERSSAAMVCCNLGVGALDAAFAHEVLQAALQQGKYTALA